MIVNVIGFGAIEFPDTMTDDEIRAVLKQFEKPKDDTVPTLLASIEKLLEKQKPQLIEVPKIQTVNTETVIKEPQVIEVERIIEKERKPVSWVFTISRDEDGINEILAEPITND